MLRGDGLPPEEVDEHRARLLAGFRWILVDEYQDIGPDQYELISALAGRTLADEDDKLSLFAVGDDDQNIYAFAGASVRFIRRFEADYQAKTMFSDGQLPLHGAHSDRRQRRHRTGRRKDEGRPSHFVLTEREARNRQAGLGRLWTRSRRGGCKCFPCPGTRSPKPRRPCWSCSDWPR